MGNMDPGDEPRGETAAQLVNVSHRPCRAARRYPVADTLKIGCGQMSNHDLHEVSLLAALRYFSSRRAKTSSAAMSSPQSALSMPF